MNKKKILILGGASIHIKVVEAAKEMGIYTIVTDYLENSPAKAMADESWMIDVTDVDEVAKKCKETGVDGVLNVCVDPCQIPYYKICEKLGLPCYGTAEQFFIMTNKPAFKQFCVENGVDIIPDYTEEDVTDGNISYPVLIKPAVSRGSRGQTICYDDSNIEEAILFAKNESSDKNIVIEKYMGDCQDFSMTYMIVDGEAKLIRTGDRYLGSKEDKLDKQAICSVSPSKHSDLYNKNVDTKIKRFIKSLGLTNAVMFMQGFIDGDTVRFYDPGLRFPGTEYERLFNIANGINLMKLLINFALTGEFGIKAEELDNAYLLGGKHALQLFVSARAGTIASYDGLDEIRENPNVIEASQRYFVGETIPPSGDVKQRICEIVLLIDENTSMKEIVSFVYSKLKVLDENGQDMVVSKIDLNKLNY